MRKLARDGTGVLGVVVGMLLGGFGGMVCSVMEMPLCDEGVVRGGVMVPGFVPGSGFSMMASRVIMVFGGFLVMLDGFL